MECTVCGDESKEFVYIVGIGHEFPICRQCIYNYGREPIQKAITGLFMLAKAKATKDLKMAWDAGFWIGHAPEVFALMAARNLSINIELAGDNSPFTLRWDLRDGDKHEPE